MTMGKLARVRTVAPVQKCEFISLAWPTPPLNERPFHPVITGLFPGQSGDDLLSWIVMTFLIALQSEENDQKQHKQKTCPLKI